jgi:hypothetical protein
MSPREALEPFGWCVAAHVTYPAGGPPPHVRRQKREWRSDGMDPDGPCIA